MARTVRELTAWVREYCGKPLNNNLQTYTIVMMMYDCLDHYRNELELTDENWIIARMLLSVDPDHDDYTLIATGEDFARPILVKSIDETNPNFAAREVPIVDLRNLDIAAGHSHTSFYPFSSFATHNATAVAFYGLPPEIHMKIVPLPNITCDYEIFYEPAKRPDPQLDESPAFLSNFYPLLCVDTALVCLPFCGWQGEKLATLERALNRKLEQLTKSFDEYRRQNKREQAGLRKPFNTYRARRHRIGARWL